MNLVAVLLLVVIALLQVLRKEIAKTLIADYYICATKLDCYLNFFLKIEKNIISIAIHSDSLIASANGDNNKGIGSSLA